MDMTSESENPLHYVKFSVSSVDPRVWVAITCRYSALMNTISNEPFKIP